MTDLGAVNCFNAYTLSLPAHKSHINGIKLPIRMVKSKREAGFTAPSMRRKLESNSMACRGQTRGGQAARILGYPT
jgi:hypothetical protein